MNILAARKYQTPRNGPLTLEQTETRRLAYSIKSTASPSIDFDTAAREMAALITGPCWLVPIPDSTGNTDANTRLAHHIARHVSLSAGGQTGSVGEGRGEVAPPFSISAFQISAFPHQHLCQVVKAIYRTQPVQSQCARHKLALGPISPEQHHLARNRKVLTLRQTYFVDNVTTSGHTLEAARLALGFGAGLVFADAATRRTQIQATLF
jgi:hypothetical protein